jgi:hypothetical protein
MAQLRTPENEADSEPRNAAPNCVETGDDRDGQQQLENPLPASQARLSGIADFVSSLLVRAHHLIPPDCIIANLVRLVFCPSGARLPRRRKGMPW